jgi:hypothetical protein
MLSIGDGSKAVNSVIPNCLLSRRFPVPVRTDLIHPLTSAGSTNGFGPVRRAKGELSSSTKYLPGSPSSFRSMSQHRISITSPFYLAPDFSYDGDPKTLHATPNLLTARPDDQAMGRKF